MRKSMVWYANGQRKQQTSAGVVKVGKACELEDCGKRKRDEL